MLPKNWQARAIKVPEGRGPIKRPINLIAHGILFAAKTDQHYHGRKTEIVDPTHAMRERTEPLTEFGRIVGRRPSDAGNRNCNYRRQNNIRTSENAFEILGFNNRPH